MSSKRDQLNAVSSSADTLTGKTVGEGFLYLLTSAGNVLPFRTPAERDFYKLNNATQLGKNRGEGDVRGH